MYLFDTDVLIWVLRGNKGMIKTVSLMKDEKPIAISVISIAEIYKNIYPSEITGTEKFLNEHIKISVTEDIAKQSGYYWQEYSSKLTRLSLTDCLIAATCKIQNADLVTFNTKHFPMTDIKVIVPSGKS